MSAVKGMNQSMDEKKANDKSFEREKQQKKSTAHNDSTPSMSYREIRTRSESEQRMRKPSNGSQRPKKNPRQDTDEKSPKAQQKKSVNGQPSGKSEEGKKQNSQQPVRKKSPDGNKPRQGQNNNHNKPHNEHNISEKKKQIHEPAKGKNGVTSVQNDVKQTDDNTPKKESGSQFEAFAVPEADESPQKEKAKKPAKPFSAKKRRRKIFALYSSMVLIILLIAAVLCLTVFFKIDSISVEGKTRYSSNEIADASGITIGTNMLLCDTDSGIDVIKKKFPYIENVSIRKNPFNSVTIFVEEAKPTTAIETNGKFYILSESGKIIEILDTNKYKVPLIKGAELKKTELSAMIEYKLQGMNDIINYITETLKNNEIKNVSTIDVTNPSNIKLSYDKRLTIIIGMPENIDYKIKTAKILIEEKLENDSKGTVDVSMCAEGGKYSYYDPSGAPED